MIKLQDELHAIKRPIRYKNPDSPLYRKRITPADNMLLTFPHLSDDDIELLRMTGTIAPATADEVRAFEAAEKDKEDEAKAEAVRARIRQKNAEAAAAAAGKARADKEKAQAEKVRAKAAQKEAQKRAANIKQKSEVNNGSDD